MAKRMRLPNGFGQISKITGKRLRNPWRAMVTIGWDLETGKPKRKTVGYYSSYHEAYDGLTEYHKNPYQITSEMTLSELYDKWSEYYFAQIQPQSRKSYMTAWKRCEMYYDTKVSDIKVPQIKTLIETDNLAPTAKKNIKNLLNCMLDYALQYDIVDKNYSRIALLDKIEMPQKERNPFTEEELNVLWEHLDKVDVVKYVLIQCYTGLRPNELLKLSSEDVDLDKWFFVTGSKTEAGKNRIVPVHPRIRPLIKDLEPYNGQYNKYIRHISQFCKDVNIQRHMGHDGRKTFITRMKEAGANDYAIKRIVGHKIEDITEKVYTTRSIEWLHKEISKIS